MNIFLSQTFHFLNAGSERPGRIRSLLLLSNCVSLIKMSYDDWQSVVQVTGTFFTGKPMRGAE
jgi:hypothetical protein